MKVKGLGVKRTDHDEGDMGMKGEVCAKNAQPRLCYPRLTGGVHMNFRSIGRRNLYGKNKSG